MYDWKQSTSEKNECNHVSDVHTLTGPRLSIQQGSSSQADSRRQKSVVVSVSVRMDLDLSQQGCSLIIATKKKKQKEKEAGDTNC